MDHVYGPCVSAKYVWRAMSSECRFMHNQPKPNMNKHHVLHLEVSPNIVSDILITQKMFGK